MDMVRVSLKKDLRFTFQASLSGYCCRFCNKHSHSLVVVPSTALISDDLDTQMDPVHIMLLVAALFIYGSTFYTCS